MAPADYCTVGNKRSKKLQFTSNRGCFIQSSPDRLAQQPLSWPSPAQSAQRERCGTLGACPA
jgi:hypothetical protein